MSSEKPTIDSLQDKGWTLVNDQQHPLGSLQGKAVDSYRLVVLLGAKNRIGASYFQVFLRNDSGEVSNQPVVIGLLNQGRYLSYNWIEIISLLSRLSFGSMKQVVDTSINELRRQLLQYLADLIPPGGHMMVECDSLEQQDTARSLALGIPPILTPLGYMLFLIGYGAGFKDWYFAEWGNEGPRKLQGHKALNSQHAKLKIQETSKELTKSPDKPSSKDILELERAAQGRALDILNRLKQQNKSKNG